MCDDVTQMTSKFLSYLGFGRAWTQAPEAPLSTPMEELDVSRLTECSICTESMSNPKFLPCHHTFCCECIEQLCRSQSTRSVPCPMCRSPFNSTSSDDAGRLPTNVYVAELVRVGAMVQDASKAKDELAAVKTKLKASEDGRQKAADEKRRQDTELARAQRKLAKQKDFSKYVEEQRKKLSQAELYQFAVQERDKYTLEQLREMESLYETAKSETESCRQAKMKAEVSLAEANESRYRLSQQLEQTQRESSEEATRLQRQIRDSKEETESLVNQLMTELEQSKGVIKNLNGQVEKKQGRHVFLMMAIIIFILYVANYKVSTAAKLSRDVYPMGYKWIFLPAKLPKLNLTTDAEYVAIIY